MFYHLWESSNRDDSNKWSNIELREEIKQVVSIEVNLMHLIWCSDRTFIFSLPPVQAVPTEGGDWQPSQEEISQNLQRGLLGRNEVRVPQQKETAKDCRTNLAFSSVWRHRAEKLSQAFGDPEQTHFSSFMTQKTEELFQTFGDSEQRIFRTKTYATFNTSSKSLCQSRWQLNALKSNLESSYRTKQPPVWKTTQY